MRVFRSAGNEGELILNGSPFYYYRKKQPFYFTCPNFLNGILVLKGVEIFGKEKVEFLMHKQNKLKRLKIFRPETMGKIPNPERINIIFANNPNKCSIDIQRHLIVFDYQFKKAFIPVAFFIYFHELGHYLYRGNGQHSEKKCDFFAAIQMQKLGFNKSQIVFAQHITLDNRDRKNFIFNLLKN